VVRIHIHTYIHTHIYTYINTYYIHIHFWRPSAKFSTRDTPTVFSNSRRPDPKMNNRPILSVPGNGKGFPEQVLDPPALRFGEQAGLGSHLVRQPQCWRNWDLPVAALPVARDTQINSGRRLDRSKQFISGFSFLDGSPLEFQK